MTKDERMPADWRKRALREEWAEQAKRWMTLADKLREGDHSVEEELDEVNAILVWLEQEIPRVLAEIEKARRDFLSKHGK